MSRFETVLLKEQNRFGYSFAVLAKFEEKLPVQYIIRINSPNGNSEDYVCNLECLTNIGELFTTLKCFAETELYPEDSKKLKNICNTSINSQLVFTHSCYVVKMG